MKDYHTLFMPLTDVYTLAGPQVFKELEGKPGKTNLQIITPRILDELDDAAERDGSEGAKKVLERIKQIQRKRRERVGSHARRRSPVTGSTYPCFEGLDVLILTNNPKNNTELAALSSKIEAEFPCEGGLELITGSDRTHIGFTEMGLRVNPPKFLQVSERIVDAGIVQGREDLWVYLEGNDGVISIDDAVDRGLFREDRFYPNQFIRFTSVGEDSSDARCYARITSDSSRIILLSPKESGRQLRIGNHYMDSVLGITPFDMEQYLALQYLLLNPTLDLAFLSGTQGSGKTVLAYAAAIDSVLLYPKEIREKRGLDGSKKGGFFDKVVLIKPTDIIGGKRRDPGHLPGTIYEKLKPHLEPYEDAHKETIMGRKIPFEALLRDADLENDFGPPRPAGYKDTKFGTGAYLPRTPAMNIIFSGFMRGRSIKNSLVIVDEAQNFTPYELKTIVERMAIGSKMIITGDPLQVDNPMCSVKINGLTSAIRHFLPLDYSGLVHMTRNYRHRMSNDSMSWGVHG